MTTDTTELKHLLYLISVHRSETAFKKFFDRYYQRFFHLACFFVKSKCLAEEAVSDAFLLIWNKSHAIMQANDVERYLYVLVKNQCLHAIRRSKELSDKCDDLYQVECLPTLIDTANPEEVYIQKERLRLLQEAILLLPEKCREVFRLKVNDHLKNKEIALILDISEKTVEGYFTSACKKIKEIIHLRN